MCLVVIIFHDSRSLSGTSNASGFTGPLGAPATARLSMRTLLVNTLRRSLVTRWPRSGPSFQTMVSTRRCLHSGSTNASLTWRTEFSWEVTPQMHGVSVQTTRWPLILVVCDRTPANCLLRGEQVSLGVAQLQNPTQQFSIE